MPDQKKPTIWARLRALINSLFSDGTVFFIPELARPLPVCKVRPMREADIPACEDLYLRNEAAHFPSGMFGRFQQSLRGDEARYLVAEVDGVVRACGGVSLQLYPRTSLGVLWFGMVHPDYRSQGFGAVMLLARLAALPVVRSPSRVVMFCVGGSETFYSRFGFTFAQLVAHSNPDYESRLYFVGLTQGAAFTCLNALQQAGIDYTRPDGALPARNFGGLGHRRS